MKNNHWLVSAVVITYNNENYILETLKSIKLQTYRNVELIITDDCSTDNTLKICKSWSKKNKHRFKRVEIVESAVNTGVAPNCNRGLKAAKGEWIKYIAGDDLLKKDCIANFVDAAKKSDAKILFSKMECFSSNEECESTRTILPYGKQEVLFSYSPEKQFNYLLTNSFNMAPSSFIKRDLLTEKNGFNETYPMVEDLPMWFKITKAGIKLHFLSKVTVEYRVHDKSVSRSRELFYNSFHKDLRRFYKKEINPHVKLTKVIFWQSQFIENLKYVLITTFFDNSVNRKSVFLSEVLDRLKLSFLVDNAKGYALKLYKKTFHAG